MNSSWHSKYSSLIFIIFWCDQQYYICKAPPWSVHECYWHRLWMRRDNVSLYQEDSLHALFNNSCLKKYIFMQLINTPNQAQILETCISQNLWNDIIALVDSSVFMSPFSTSALWAKCDTSIVVSNYASLVVSLHFLQIYNMGRWVRKVCRIPNGIVSLLDSFKNRDFLRPMELQIAPHLLFDQILLGIDIQGAFGCSTVDIDHLFLVL